MKHLIVALMTILVVGLSAFGTGQAAAADIRTAIEMYPAAGPSVNEQIHLRLTRQGRIHETVTYLTADSLAVVLREYSGLYQPIAGQHKASQCVILTRSDRYLAVRQTTLVTLCPLAQGTQVIIERNLYMG